jgi:hypothetical protein
VTLGLGSTISDNMAVYGGGIDNNAAGTLTLSSTIVDANTATGGTGFGGGIYNGGGPVKLTSTTVQCNVPDQIVGPYTQVSSTVGGGCV